MRVRFALRDRLDVEANVEAKIEAEVWLALGIKLVGGGLPYPGDFLADIAWVSRVRAMM